MLQTVQPTPDSLWAQFSDLLPKKRGLMGADTRETLDWLEREYGIDIQGVKTGQRIFDWTVPPAWVFRSARLVHESGQVVVEASQRSLNVVAYSRPLSMWVTLEELQNHLHSREDLPEATPYVTSYYEHEWGFALSHAQRAQLRDGNYHVTIDAEYVESTLEYGEIVLTGKSSKEILFSTYICHPELANDNTSGIAVTASLIDVVDQIADRKWTYRFVFVPETIGALAFIKRQQSQPSQFLAGFVVTCVGDEGSFSYIPTPSGNTIADDIAVRTLDKHGHEWKRYSWRDRGSDERQYCAPGVGWPVCSITRTKYREFDEYHSSADAPGFVTARGLYGSLELYERIVRELEKMSVPVSLVTGEPMLGKRNLYPGVSSVGQPPNIRLLVDVWSLCDGSNDAVMIGNKLGVALQEVLGVIEVLERHRLVTTF